MSRAEEYGCQRDHSDVAEGDLIVGISTEQVTRPSPGEESLEASWGGRADKIQLETRPLTSWSWWASLSEPAATSPTHLLHC